MKRRILLIILAVFMCAFLVTALAKRAALSQLDSCVIQYDKLISEYTLNCTVHGNRHYYCFDGYLTKIEKQEGDRVSRDDMLVRYTDSRGRSASLKTDSDGWLLSLSGNQAVVEDGQMRLYCQVPVEKYTLLRVGQQGSFTLNGRLIIAEIEEKNDIAVEEGRQLHCRLILKIVDEAELLSGQKVNVLMPLQQLYGLCVDEKALLVDEEGYYLLDAEAADDLTNWSAYRLNVQVIAQGQGKVMVSGIQLENREVLILPAEYLKVLSGHD
ncbi:MAG: hypothetical protein IJM79_02750 [Erysipelotrichaceae bacterium]|nr:hypothetical protein [Erysipelotrichaceae bacterium]